MEENLADQRKSYEKSVLNRKNLEDKPMRLFKRWFDEVEKADQIAENNAMTLSTIDKDGFPKNRVVLLKKFNDKGFVFYTNYHSEKGMSILKNPRVCLSFFWPVLERQVIVKGRAEKVPPEESDRYFSTRPRGSRIGAWVSPQSKIIEGRKSLEDKKIELIQKFEGQTVDRPDFWGGFLIKPLSVEFWQGRPSRLHDRFKYNKEENNWKIFRLAP